LLDRPTWTCGGQAADSNTPAHAGSGIGWPTAKTVWRGNTKECHAVRGFRFHAAPGGSSRLRRVQRSRQSDTSSPDEAGRTRCGVTAQATLRLPPCDRQMSRFPRAFCSPGSSANVRPNPKSKARNAKQIQNSKHECPKRRSVVPTGAGTYRPTSFTTSLHGVMCLAYSCYLRCDMAVVLAPEISNMELVSDFGIRISCLLRPCRVKKEDHDVPVQSS